VVTGTSDAVTGPRYGRDAGEPAEPEYPADAVRLDLLTATEGLDESELLRLALQQAVAALGGIGGLAHLAGQDEGTLRLAAVNGLPAEIARPWDELPRSGEVAPALAVDYGKVVWSTSRPPDAEGRPPGRLVGGVLSAPLMVDRIAVGALSVLTTGPPSAERRMFLAKAADVVGARLPGVRQWRSGTPPWWQEPLGAPRSVMHQINVGRWSWDLTTGTLAIDEVTEELMRSAGLDPDNWDRRIETWMERIHPDDRPDVQKSIDESLRGAKPYAVEYRVVGDSGQVSWLEVRAGFKHDTTTGAVARVIGTVWNVTQRRSQLEWLVGMVELHPDPIHVVSPDDTVRWANQAARRLEATEGGSIEGTVPWDQKPELAEQGLPELLARARAAPGAPATLRVRRWEEARGAVAHYLVRAVEMGGFVTAQMSDITEQVEVEQAAAVRGKRVAELNAALIRALDTSDVVGAVAEHVLPLVGAEGLILHDLTGSAPRLVGDIGPHPEFLRDLHRWSGCGRPDRTGDAPRFIGSSADLDRQWPDRPASLHAENMGGWAMLPLIVGARRVGTCVISWARPREFTEDDRSLLGTIGVVVAQALGNARRYEDARNRAERLQHELLPGRLPDLVSVRAAARYRPAAGQGVGGDWYDVVPLPGGRTLAVIGDIVGHGEEHSIIMGIVRHAVLTVAALDLPVDEVLAHLNDVVVRLGRNRHGTGDDDAVYATCCLALYDPTTGTCSIASAGHPMPVVARPGQAPRELRVPMGQPLGIALVPAQITETVLEPGSLLVLYTDGLLGTDNPDISGLTAAISRQTAAESGSTAGQTHDARWLASLCDTITADLPPDRTPDDDAALLTLSVGRAPADRIAVWDLPRAPESAGDARRHALGQLETWGLRSLTDSLTLVVSELVGNTYRHAAGIEADDEDTGLIRLRLLYLDDALICEVYDGSEATPRVHHPHADDEFGRGLQLVAMTATNWGARYTENGKCIWASFEPARLPADSTADSTAA
jgi:GAF domain-containing protein